MRTSLIVFVSTFAASAFISFYFEHRPPVISLSSAEAASVTEPEPVQLADVSEQPLVVGPGLAVLSHAPTAAAASATVTTFSIPLPQEALDLAMKYSARATVEATETAQTALRSVPKAAEPGTSETTAPARAPAVSSQPAATLAASAAQTPSLAPAPIDTSRRAPAHVSIPSAGIDSPVVGVGINGAGEMAVPSGSTNDVGWYKYGTTPGDVGSAVLDAHVFAAFSTLKDVSVGDSIVITTEGGQKLRFVVDERTVYKLGNLSPELLFNRRDTRRLNLITCAGELTADRSTYTHRLVLYAVYAGLA